MKKMFARLVIGGMLVAGICWADEEVEGVNVGFDELPARVQQIVLGYFDMANINEIEKVAEHDTVQYEVEGMANGEEMDIVLASDGTLMETTVQVDLESLPPLAREALARDYPEGVVKEIEKVVEVSYNVEIIVNGEEWEIEVEASGNIEDNHDTDGMYDDDDDDTGQHVSHSMLKVSRSGGGI